MKDWLGRNWKLFMPIALALDLVLVFGPTLFDGSPYAFAMLSSRWCVMGLGIWTIDLSKLHDPYYPRLCRWCSAYLVFGFTAAGMVNSWLTPPT